MKNLLKHTRRPDITFYRNGRIRIAANVVRALSLRSGDSINIACANGEYLLFAIHHTNAIGRHVARCYPSKNGGKNFCATSVSLCRSMLSAINVSADKVAFMVGETITINGSLHLPIITKSPDIKI
ncbi:MULTISPECIES: hypothetical protein [Muribaculaceae]|uniref:hypothetical protein n=1 Tax=Muribaculaceae TaxID=2005473 RepID=UPI002648EA57|nr:MULTISPECIES: hypothetical protein [Muribaculaceae]